MKKIFLDENIRDVKLVRKLKKLGHDLVFKPQGVSDYDIQFDLKFVENKSFLVDTSEPVNGCVVLIDAFMSQFKE